MTGSLRASLQIDLGSPIFSPHFLAHKTRRRCRRQIAWEGQYFAAAETSHGTCRHALGARMVQDCTLARLRWVVYTI